MHERDLVRAALMQAIRDRAPDRAQVGGKTVTPEDAADAVLGIRDFATLMDVAHVFAVMADEAAIAAEAVQS